VVRRSAGGRLTRAKARNGKSLETWEIPLTSIVRSESKRHLGRRLKQMTAGRHPRPSRSPQAQVRDTETRRVAWTPEAETTSEPGLRAGKVVRTSI